MVAQRTPIRTRYDHVSLPSPLFQQQKGGGRKGKRGPAGLCPSRAIWRAPMLERGGGSNSGTKSFATGIPFFPSCALSRFPANYYSKFVYCLGADDSVFHHLPPSHFGVHSGGLRSLFSTHPASVWYRLFRKRNRNITGFEFQYRWYDLCSTDVGISWVSKFRCDLLVSVDVSIWNFLIY